MNCFCTLLYSDDYLPGALVLGTRLKLFDPTLVRIVLVTDQVSAKSRRILGKVFTQVRLVEPIIALDSPELALLGRPELSAACTKLRIWQLTEYRRVVYLDADTLPLASLAHLFDALPVDKQIAASPDIGWPDIFNSGVLVTEPSLAVFQQLVELVHTGDSFDGSDQGLLNSFFTEWANLGFTYNVTASGNYQYAPAYQRFKRDIKVFHFIGSHKPWNSSNNGEMFELWRSVDISGLLETPRTLNYSPKFDQAKLVAPSINRWDPTKFEPPVTSKAEAAQFDESRLEITEPDFEFPEFGEPLFKFPWESKPARATRVFPRGFQ